MKTIYKCGLALLLGSVFIYTGCKKSGSSPATASQPASTKVIGGQIAMNLAQSLTGALGGANINDGVAAPAIGSSNAKTRKLTTSSDNCGFFVDSALNFNSNLGDTVQSSTTGSLSFYFFCKNSQSIGYTLDDSLHVTGKAPGYTYANSIVQVYNVTGVNTNNSDITINGRIKSFVDIKYTQKGTTPLSLHNTYILNGLFVNLSDNSDITQGTATFVSIGSSSSGSWEYTGTITFLGNHKVKINFYNNIYYVDLTTGAVTSSL